MLATRARGSAASSRCAPRARRPCPRHDQLRQQLARAAAAARGSRVRHALHPDVRDAPVAQHRAQLAAVGRARRADHDERGRSLIGDPPLSRARAARDEREHDPLERRGRALAPQPLVGAQAVPRLERQRARRALRRARRGAVRSSGSQREQVRAQLAHQRRVLARRKLERRRAQVPRALVRRDLLEERARAARPVARARSLAAARANSALRAAAAPAGARARSARRAGCPCRRSAGTRVRMPTSRARATCCAVGCEHALADQIEQRLHHRRAAALAAPHATVDRVARLPHEKILPRLALFVFWHVVCHDVKP